MFRIGLIAVILCHAFVRGDSESPSDGDGQNQAAAGRSAPVQRRILVLGGNGFLGADTVQALIDNGDSVTMVNRGNWYWDSYSRIRPFVDHVSCDRKNGIDSCEGLVKLVREIDQFDAVIDFSAFEPKDMKDSTSLLKGKSKVYIMISTDSIYEVCDKEQDGPSRETDSVRPAEEDERDRLAHRNQYANNKMSAEEELIRQREVGDGLPYVILRLPDVVGPRDSTFRWWLYQLWAKLDSHTKLGPITIMPFLVNYSMSFVFSGDVSKLIFDLISQEDGKVHDQIFNVAYPETYTINDIITTIRKELGVEDTEVPTEADQSDTLFVYPSVRKGPIDVSKIEEMLDWKPTPWDTAAQQTVSFFEEAMSGERYNTQRDEIVQILTAHLFEKRKDDVYDALEKIYGINLHHFRPRDEL